MKVRAAVLEEFGRPLAVQEVDARRAEGRRGARPARGLRGLPHRPLRRVGRGPDRLHGVRARPRGRGRRRARRAGRHARRAGRPRRHALRARVRRVRPLPQPAHEPLRGDPRQPGRRLPARRDDALRAERGAAPPLHGHIDLRRVHRHARDRAGEGRSGGSARRLRALRLRPLDRNRRRALHGAGHARLDLRRLRLRPRRPRRRDRLPARGCGPDRRDRPVRGAPRRGAPARRDRHPARGRRTRSSGFAPRPAASAPTTPSRRPAACG